MTRLYKISGSVSGPDLLSAVLATGDVKMDLKRGYLYVGGEVCKHSWNLDSWNPEDMARDMAYDALPLLKRLGWRLENWI